MTTPTDLLIYAPGKEFLLPYFRRELPDRNVEMTPRRDEARLAVVEPGDDIAGFPDDADILVCPNIVGTGMTGVPMKIARHILQGTFFHLAGNEARLSTIHATDVAKAARLVLERPHDGGTKSHIISDGENPTYRDFAEAIASRLGNRRITTLSSRWNKWLLFPALRRLITRDAVVDGSVFAREFNFEPVPVTEYLRTHDYNDESL